MKKLLIIGVTAVAALGMTLAVSAADAYIESDGSTAINSGVFPGTDLRVEVDFALVEASANHRILGGYDENNQTIELYVNSSSGLSFQVAKGWPGATSLGSADYERHVFIADVPANKCHFVTGTTTNSYTAHATSPIDGDGTIPITLFGRIYNTNGSTYYRPYSSKARIYGVKFYRSGELVRNLVPCVKGDAVGFRDTIGGTFHTGELEVSGLTAGGDVERIPDDGFIELSGNDQTQSVKGGHYIETGYNPGPGTRIELDYGFGANRAPNVDGDWYIISSADNTTVRFGMYQNKSTLGVSLGTGLGKNIGMPAQTNACCVRRKIILDSPNAAVTLSTAGYVNYANTNDLFSSATSTHDKTIKLGTSYGGGGGYTPLRIYGFKIYENGTLYRDYVPMVTNGAPVLYSALGNSLLKVSWNANHGLAGIPKAGGAVAVSSARDRDAFVLFTGAQSLDTGYKASSKSKFVIDFSFANGYNKPQQFVFETGSEIMGRIYTGGSSGTGAGYSWGYSKGDSNWIGTGVTVDHQRRLFTIDSANAQVRMTPNISGGTYNADSTIAGFDRDYTCTKTTKISSNVAGTGNYSRLRLYRFAIYDDGELVRDYVPLVKGGSAGLYDLVNGGNVLTASGLTVSGRGHDGEEEWVVRPQSAVLKKGDAVSVISAVATGAQFYKWTKNGETIEGGADGNLTVTWAKGGKTDTYAVTPVYSVFGEEVEGEAVPVTVENVPQGLIISFK